MPTTMKEWYDKDVAVIPLELIPEHAQRYSKVSVFIQPRQGRPTRLQNHRCGNRRLSCERIGWASILTDLGFSRERIAMLLKISVTTVRDIAHGRTRSECRTPDDLEPHETRLDNPVTCPGCNARIVIIPCRACAARLALEKK